MHLLIRRTQRDDGWIWSSITFIIYTQLDLTEEEKFQFTKCDLFSRIAYNSEGFLEHLEAAEGYRKKNEGTDNSEWGEIFANSLAELYHNIAGKFALQLSVQNLADGIHIESQELEEIIRIESLIRMTAHNLADYVGVALTFDGQEHLDEY